MGIVDHAEVAKKNPKVDLSLLDRFYTQLGQLEDAGAKGTAHYEIGREFWMQRPQIHQGDCVSHNQSRTGNSPSDQISSTD